MAFHEAGHVVAALAMGFDVESVTIVPDKSRGTIDWYSAGRTKFQNPLPSRMNNGSEEDCKKAAIVLLAGDEAQRKISPHSVKRPDWRFGSDCLNLQVTVGEWQIPELKKATRDLIEKHWPVIEMIAFDLLNHGTITKENGLRHHIELIAREITAVRART